MVSFSSIKKRLHQIRSHRPTKLNPDYHTSPYTTLSAQQFRSESARKTHAKTHGHPVTSGKPTSKGAAGANDADSSHVVEASEDQETGSAKIRGLQTRYSWFRTTGTLPTPGPGAIPKGGTTEPGSLRVHHYDDGTQVWVLDHVKGITRRQLHWVAANNGFGPHPALPDYYLQLHSEEHKLPTWVKRHTLTTYASKKRKASGGRDTTAEASVGSTRTGAGGSDNDNGSSVTIRL